MAEDAARGGCDFVVTTGDNFYDDGVGGHVDPHWHDSFERVYAAPSLQVPWYAALGNHDHRGSIEAQIARSQDDPRWRMPARRYVASFPGPAGGLDLFVIDTTAWLAEGGPSWDDRVIRRAETDPRSEAAWLRARLGRSRAARTIVVGHHPVLSGSPCHGSSEELQRWLAPILEEHRVDLYLAGHEHDLQHLEAGGVHHAVSGAGAEVRPTGTLPESVFADAALGYVVVEVDLARPRAALSVAWTSVDGGVVHEARVEGPPTTPRRWGGRPARRSTPRDAAE